MAALKRLMVFLTWGLERTLYKILSQRVIQGSNWTPLKEKSLDFNQARIYIHNIEM